MILRIYILLLASLFLVSCTEQEEFPARDNTAEVEEFYAYYNEQVKEKIERDIEELEKALSVTEFVEEEFVKKEAELAELKVRLKAPEYFSFKAIDDLPQDLDWETNWDEPELGSDEAKKGGVFHTYFTQFPPTLRVIGDQSNNSFRGEHSDNIHMGMVTLHPNTGAMIPSLADRWAVSEDKRTVYFHIDDKATYNDGVAVKTGDIFMAFYMSLGPYVHTPYRKEYFSTQFTNITRYDDKTYSITLTDPKPLTALEASVGPFPQHFYNEVGPDFAKRYNWRPQPTTGAYIIKGKDILKGRSITLSRVENWWAKDRKYTKNTYNADKIEYRLIRDSNTALEYFKRGKLDFITLNNPKNWYEKTEFDAVFDGYIEKVTFYADYPAVPRGIYINCAKPPLDQVDVRIGLQYATNFEKVIDFEFRGDAARLKTFNDGYGRYSHPTLVSRAFSIERAQEHFTKAGFTKRGDDGVLMNDQGQRLSFTITYPSDPLVSAIISRLKEEAIKAGVEYKPEGLDGSEMFLKGLEKKHQLIFSGWGSGPPFPTYRQFFHSSNAFEPNTKELKPMTNNFSVYADSEMDQVADAVRDAISLDEIERNAHRAEELIYRDAPWIPGYTIPLIRCGYWRWMQWPDDFNVKQTRDLESTYLYWIDEDIKKETEKAMRDGDTFPEKNLIFDQYRK
ncbi:MAG: ABC transporter substrate-binding protein [Akkermansiaceae bacterium]